MTVEFWRMYVTVAGVIVAMTRRMLRKIASMLVHVRPSLCKSLMLLTVARIAISTAMGIVKMANVCKYLMKFPNTSRMPIRSTVISSMRFSSKLPAMKMMRPQVRMLRDR